MKYIKYRSLFAAFMAANATMAVAQESEAVSDSLGVMPQKTVQLAFRDASESEVMVGVSSVDVEDLLTKNYFTYSRDNLQAYLAGWNGNIWGHDSYLVLIDGVKRDIDNVKPDEIASISLLKGANAVALYGSHAAKGVILISTKRGVEQDLKIDVRANTGFAVAKSFPEYLGSAEYMYYYNQACNNQGEDPIYSHEEIFNYASGKNPYRYPDVDLYSSDYMKKAYNRSDVTAEIIGGNQRARYYTNISYYRQGTLLDFGSEKKGYEDRFNVRSNVDVDITDYISARVDANVSFKNAKGHRAYEIEKDNWITYYQWAERLRPNRVVPLVPIKLVDSNSDDAQAIIANMSNTVDGCFLGGTQTDKANPIANVYAAGTNQGVFRQFQFDTGLNFDLSPLTEGLSFDTQFALDYKTSYDIVYEEKYAIYEPIWSNFNGKEVIVGLENYETKDVHTGTQNIYNTKSDMVIAFNAHFNYDRKFDDHTFGAVVAVDGFQNRVPGKYHSDSDANLGFNVRYDFAKRYFLDFNAAVTHSAKLPKETRNGFAPSVTVGWNAANESFLDGSIFDDLTISASASKLNTDEAIDGYTLYVGSYSETEGAWWGWSGNESIQSVVSTRGENPSLDFIKRKEMSLGLHAALLNRMITFNASLFRTSMEGMIIQTDNIMPSYMQAWINSDHANSSFYSNINYNEDLRKGFDFSVNFNKKIKEVGLSIGVNGMYVTNEAQKRDDTQYSEDYQKRQGKYLDGLWGYECLGFFTSDADVASHADQKSFGGTPKAGDLKYKDQNGDNKIDQFDQIELGHQYSPMTLGFNITAKYANFTLFVGGNGEFGGLGTKNNSYYCPQTTEKYSSAVRDAWTERTASSAKYPRLTTGSQANNRAVSDFWTFKKNQINLSKVQLTYDFASSVFEGNKVFSGLSVYVSGSDLLKISKEREHMELNIGSAPQTRFFNLGAKVSF
ncbi:MAG: SusC/RagA family TonB-linked outer membrane protein [Bacteroidales bacterium]|nr:SusC/RagA family TonB-linked outer membrane protein [Bacteroidales bacterium]